MKSTWKFVDAYDTEYPADAVEWCPIEPHWNYFVCGTYFLQDSTQKPTASLQDAAFNGNESVEKSQERIGTLSLLNLENKKINFVQKIQCQGILDVKWCNEMCQGNVLLGAVSAKGDAIIYKLNDLLLLEFLDSVNLRTDEHGDYMVLALNWHSSSEKVEICVTDNQGSAAIIRVRESKLTIDEKWNAHSLEAWTVAFDFENSNVLYTGGDDAKLKMWDRRVAPVSQASVNSFHNTGVTIIQTDSGKENLLLVGSFDEFLNIFDYRRLKAPVNQVRCSGGLWRAKRRMNHILTANIYGGFQIVDMDSPQVVADYKEHESLAYGADWSHLPGDNVAQVFGVSKSSSLIGTCSFYDKKLTVSIWDAALFECTD